MSASVDKIPNVVHGIDGDDDDDEEEEEDAAIEKLQRRRRGFGRAKEAVLHPFTKAKNKIRRIRSRRALFRSSSSSYFSGNASSSRGSSGKVIVRGDDNRTENGNGNGNGNCTFCFSRPRVLESGDDSSPTTSDPNDPKFTHAMLRALIENNDFYSKECNPHVD